VTVGQISAPSTVTLTNGATKTLKIRGTAIGTNYIVVGTTCASTLAAGQSCDYLLSFHPLGAGTKNQVFTVRDSINSPQKVQLHGIGQR
jgi:hypothetical protein